MSTVRIPHFALPFKLSGDHFSQNEQGSVEDVVACVKSVLLTEPGERQLLPEFGLSDPAFQMQGASVAAITDAVAIWEPRAAAVAKQNPDQFSALLGDVAVPVKGDEG